MNASKTTKSNSYPPWAPRIWTGILPSDYWKLLSENRFSIHPTRYPMAALMVGWSILNFGFAGIQKAFLGSRIADTEIDPPPVFIVGHWRSGTTLLHEVMSQDPEFAFPNNLDTFIPSHFLVTGPIAKPALSLVIPKKRPMDNMSVQVDSPQEDDFAIMLLGAATHYRRMGFPHNQNEYYKWLDCENLSPDQNAEVKKQLTYFLKAVTYKYRKRLILKSPPHTGRINKLAKWFPGAKFVHISRHPYKIVPSTMRLWKIADEVHAYQRPFYDDQQLFEYVNRCQSVMYGAYRRDRVEMKSNQIVEVSFEQFVREPETVLRQIYSQLELEGVESVVEKSKTYFEQRKNHQQNSHEIGQFADAIDESWSEYFADFGYSRSEHSTANEVA